MASFSISFVGACAIAAALLIRPMPWSWAVILIMIGLIMQLLSYGVSTIPVAPAKDNVEDYIMGAEVHGMGNGLVKIVTQQGAIFLLKKIGTDEYWLQQVDEEGLYMGPPLQANKPDTVKYVKFILSLIERRK